MRTAEEILKKWHTPLHGIGEIAELQIVEAMKEYAIEVAKETLKNVSENVKTIVYNEIDEIYEIDKRSILNESNIPTL